MNKYHAKKVVYNGIKFDSMHERDRYIELMLMERAGVISNLKLQDKMVLIDGSGYGRPIYYIADFSYDENGERVYEDAKSPITRKNPVYRLKRRMFMEKYHKYIKET